MGKQKNADDYISLLRKLNHAGLSGSAPPNHINLIDDDIPSLEERTHYILGLVNNKNRKASNMLFFVMYDIESNKVRRYIVKYLQRKGCTRVQKSIFLADLDSLKYEEIKHDLTDVQSVYENNDSILIVPISTEYLKSMRIIGQNIDIDIITHSNNTLFF